MKGRGIVTPEELKKFLPFQGLDEHQLLLLANNVELRRVPRGARLFEYGEIDNSEYFLLLGELELKARDGGARRVADHDETARRQIARLRPRQYTATATRESHLFVLDADILKQLQEELGSGGSGEAVYDVHELGSLDESESRELFADFKLALKRNNFVLPSLPEVAGKVRQLLADENVNAEKIAHAVNTDPAIAAKLIRAANSPLYHGSSKCESTRSAIVRLGMHNTKQLVVSFTLRDLFQTKSEKLKTQMKEAWQHSVEVAAISFVICRMIKTFPYPPEEVALAGLLHNIGVIAILSYIETHPSLLHDNVKLQQIIQQLRADAGVEILTRWKFPEIFIEVARSVESWQRDHVDAADICDIVQIAKLHSYIRNRQPLPVSHLDSVPALYKLPLGTLTPELTIQILDESRGQINDAVRLLAG